MKILTKVCDWFKNSKTGNDVERIKVIQSDEDVIVYKAYTGSLPTNKVVDLFEGYRETLKKVFPNNTVVVIRQEDDIEIIQDYTKEKENERQSTE